MNYTYADDIPLHRVRLLNSEAARPFLEQILKTADEAISQPPEVFLMSAYSAYYKTGKRKKHDGTYLDKRRKCMRLAAAFWLSEDEKYLEPLIDYIGSVCDEFTWCLPAHTQLLSDPVQDAIEYVDLYQSETARLFAEILMCMGDKLPAYIKERMAFEVQRRVIAPLCKGKKFWWLSCNNNWSSVCAGSCALAALYFGTREQQEKLLPILFATSDNYLAGIEDSGCCTEGMAYWNYGVSHFILLADIMKWCGRRDCFQEPKVRNLALFPQRTRMSEAKCVAFSDTSENFKVRLGPICFLKRIYPEVCLPELEYTFISQNVDSFFELLWMDPDYKADPMKQESCYLEDAQWYISKKKTYSFAACGGNNGVSHNHNDVGNFIVTVGDQTFLPDLGCGEYIRETFQAETRYDFVQNCSRGHSVPIVNGAYQLPGREYKAKNVVATENSFALELQDAYPAGTCKKLCRRFDLEEDAIILVDTVEGAQITERFISRICPRVCEGYVDYEVGRILFDPELLEARIGQETFTSHDGLRIVTAYQTDFISKDPNCTEYSFRILPLKG